MRTTELFSIIYDSLCQTMLCKVFSCLGRHTSNATYVILISVCSSRSAVSNASGLLLGKEEQRLWVHPCVPQNMGSPYHRTRSKMQQSSSLSPSSAGEHRVLLLYSFRMHVLEVGEGVKLEEKYKKIH